MKFNFPLSMMEVPVRLAVRADGFLNPKDYVLKLQFPGVDSTRGTAEDLKLYFSDALGALYLYNEGQREGQTGHTKFFQLPNGVFSMTVEVEQWSKREDVAKIERVDLQIQAPWSGLNRLTQIGIASNDS